MALAPDFCAREYVYENPTRLHDSINFGQRQRKVVYVLENLVCKNDIVSCRVGRNPAIYHFENLIAQEARFLRDPMRCAAAVVNIDSLAIQARATRDLHKFTAATPIIQASRLLDQGKPTSQVHNVMVIERQDANSANRI